MFGIGIGALFFLFVFTFFGKHKVILYGFTFFEDEKEFDDLPIISQDMTLIALKSVELHPVGRF